jgi:hypothetical protein
MIGTKRTCSEPDCDYPHFAKGFCKFHQWKRPKKDAWLHKRKRKEINRISGKRKKEMAIYRRKRDVFMKKHEVCEVCKNAKPTDLHHRKGRSGKMIYKERYFLAVCRPCHTKIENNPIWAKKNGYSVDRL